MFGLLWVVNGRMNIRLKTFSTSSSIELHSFSWLGPKTLLCIVIKKHILKAPRHMRNDNPNTNEN